MQGFEELKSEVISGYSVEYWGCIVPPWGLYSLGPLSFLLINLII